MLPHIIRYLHKIHIEITDVFSESFFVTPEKMARFLRMPADDEDAHTIIPKPRFPKWCYMKPSINNADQADEKTDTDEDMPLVSMGAKEEKKEHEAVSVLASMVLPESLSSSSSFAFLSAYSSSSSSFAFLSANRPKSPISSLYPSSSAAESFDTDGMKTLRIVQLTGWIDDLEKKISEEKSATGQHSESDQQQLTKHRYELVKIQSTLTSSPQQPEITSSFESSSASSSCSSELDTGMRLREITSSFGSSSVPLSWPDNSMLSPQGMQLREITSELISGSSSAPSSSSSEFDTSQQQGMRLRGRQISLASSINSKKEKPICRSKFLRLQKEARQATDVQRAIPAEIPVKPCGCRGTCSKACQIQQILDHIGEWPCHHCQRVMFNTDLIPDKIHGKRVTVSGEEVRVALDKKLRLSNRQESTDAPIRVVVSLSSLPVSYLAVFHAHSLCRLPVFCSLLLS